MSSRYKLCSLSARSSPTVATVAATFRMSQVGATVSSNRFRIMTGYGIGVWQRSRIGKIFEISKRYELKITFRAEYLVYQLYLVLDAAEACGRAGGR